MADINTENVESLGLAWYFDYPTNRGMAGVDECITYRLFDLAGVPASRTSYFHFRVIDNATEQAFGSNPKDGSSLPVTEVELTDSADFSFHRHLAAAYISGPQIIEYHYRSLETENSKGGAEANRLHRLAVSVKLKFSQPYPGGEKCEQR